MRKLTFGIFTVFTVALFLLSGSVNVAATTVTFDDYTMHSVVYPYDPWAVAYIDPDLGYEEGQDLEINNGDNVRILIPCYMSNFYPPGFYLAPTGYHLFEFYWYYSGYGVPGTWEAPIGKYTHCFYWGVDYFDITIDNCQENEYIFIYIIVTTTNIPEDETDQDGGSLQLNLI